MKYIIGNWKMHLGVRESVALTRGVLRSLRGNEDSPEIVLCPPFTALSEVYKVLARSRVSMGAQNCGPERNGAYTGEVSVAMLEDLHAEFVLIGHSERRNNFHESNEEVAIKMRLVLDSKITPILCVGESKDIRESAKANEFVHEQISTALHDVRIVKGQDLFIAYEPIWAIGSGEPASISDIIEMHSFIRDAVSQEAGITRENVKVFYGGSVDEENAYDFLRESDIDGLLIGGSSLKLASFIAIIDAARDVMAAQA